MEPDTPIDLGAIPVVPITESMKVKTASASAPVAAPTPEELAKTMEAVAVPLPEPKLEVPADAEPVEVKIAEQLATFRAAPAAVPVAAAPLFQYHQGGMKAPVNLEFQEFDDPSSHIHIKLRSVEKTSKDKIKELGKIIQQTWDGAVNIDGKFQRKKGFEAFVYFLKYRRLETRDRNALDELRKVALNRGVCFIFVDEVFNKINKVATKLQSHGLLPPGAILLPWHQDFSLDQLKTLIGLTVSARFEDMTKSMRSINRVLIPPLPKKD